MSGRVDLTADEAIALVVGPRNADRGPDKSPWVATGEVRDEGWAWVFGTNLASAAEDFLSGAIGQGLSVVAKDGTLIADTGSAPGMEERVAALHARWLRERAAFDASESTD